MSSINSTCPRRPATILIVDDEPIQLRAIVAELNTFGFEILLAEMHNPPSRMDLAHRVGTNQSALGQEFQRHLGMSPFEYLREQRLARAQVLLASGVLQIQQIADTIGFKRTGDFATAFKRRFGLTPRDYRRQRQSQPKD